MDKKKWSLQELNTLFKTREKCDFIPAYDTYVFTKEELFRYGGITAGLLLVFSWILFDLPILSVVFLAPALILLLGRMRVHHMKRRKKLLLKQFLSAGTLLADYLRSGYAIESAVQKSNHELVELWGEGSDIVEEWRRMRVGLSLNRPIEEVFREFGLRTNIEEIREFGALFSIVKRSGGQLAEVIHEKMAILRETFSVEEQIENMVTAKKYEQRIMDIMPLAIVFYMRLAAPDLLAPLYTTLMGRLVMSGCLCAYVATYFWAEKIVDIEV